MLSSTTDTGIGAGNSSEEESSSITNTPISQTTPPRTTMEEAWKHFNLASLSSSARVPFGNGPPNNSMVISSSTTADPTSLNSPPPMMQNQHYFQLFCINTPIIINPNQRLANASSSFGTAKKRLPESDLSNSDDARHKRMIKNRESAARSRARKQAYTDELELKVQHLKEENARIKRLQQEQQESISFAAASGQSKKHNHRRSTSA